MGVQCAISHISILYYIAFRQFYYNQNRPFVASMENEMDSKPEIDQVFAYFKAIYNPFTIPFRF